MKKLTVILLLFTACQPTSRTYVNHTEGPYSIANDTLLIQSDLLINRSSYQKIRNGQCLPKQYMAVGNGTARILMRPKTLCTGKIQLKVHAA